MTHIQCYSTTQLGNSKGMKKENRIQLYVSISATKEKPPKQINLEVKVEAGEG